MSYVDLYYRMLKLVSFFTCSGSRDGSIHYHDVRKPEHCVAKSEYHHLEVCGMKWSTDGKYLASGANDNLVCIWNAKNPQEPHQILRGHQAAVKVSEYQTDYTYSQLGGVTEAGVGSVEEVTRCCYIGCNQFVV